jgi:Raf kinase inhibitor-like YbhB/YbcL family protein
VFDYEIRGNKLFTIIFYSIIIILTCVACQQSSPSVENKGVEEVLLKVSSSAFSEGEEIPGKYTCDGEDLSVPLSWSGVPGGTQSLVLIVDDPDAPGGEFDHWILYDLPADIVILDEGVKDIGTPGENGFRKLGYNGPCPPGGPAHRYYFKIYALDTTLNLQPGASKDEVEEAMQGHLLADGQLMGTYHR